MTTNGRVSLLIKNNMYMYGSEKYRICNQLLKNTVLKEMSTQRISVDILKNEMYSCPFDIYSLQKCTRDI